MMCALKKKNQNILHNIKPEKQSGKLQLPHPGQGMRWCGGGGGGDVNFSPQPGKVFTV